jgi:hypothetical protein
VPDLDDPPPEGFGLRPPIHQAWRDNGLIERVTLVVQRHIRPGAACMISIGHAYPAPSGPRALTAYTGNRA